VVEESFWHKEYVIASTIVIEEIFVRFRHEVSRKEKKSAMQSVMQKSAMKEQQKFQMERNTRRQIKEEKPRIWARFKVWVEVAMLVYMMELEDRLIYLCKGYAGLEKVIMVEVYVMEMENRLTVEDNDMGTVIKIVFEMEYKTAGMQKKLTVEKGDINMSVEVVRTAIVEVVRTAITKKEYNTTKIERKLNVEEGDTYMFEDIHMMNVNIIKFVEMDKEVFYKKFEDIHMRKVVIFKFREVVRKIIDKELIIEENIITHEDTNMRDRVIFKFEKTVIKMDYRTAEMKKRFTIEKEKLTVQGGDINKFEAIHMRDAVIIKFVEVVRTAIMKVVRTAIMKVVRTAIDKEKYKAAEMQEEQTVKKEKGTRKTFGASATERQDSVLSGRVREIVESRLPLRYDSWLE
jgi:hypothetical protein